MAFSKYKNIGQVQQEFSIRAQRQDFILAEEVQPSENFLREFEFTVASFAVFRSESARTEAIIFPILREVYKSYSDRVSLWIQEPLEYDARLKGTPDYLVANKSPLGVTVFTKPLLAVVEAKKNDFEYGWGQCLAELVAVQKLNGEEHLIVYGIVTDGEFWQFGKLEKDLFTQNALSYPLGDLPGLFGALHFIFRALQPVATSPSRP
jgi:hypothetical protein